MRILFLSIMFMAAGLGWNVRPVATNIPAQPESQVCYGPMLITDNMHNMKIAGAYNPSVYREFANSWFKHYVLTVSAPAGWHFTGEPYVNCVKDDQGAFQ